MREIISLNDNWIFTKDNKEYYNVDIPHTWNAIDGTDGGNDYYRGKCHYNKSVEYKKTFDKEVFLEFQGASQVCDVFVNDKLVGHHDGGYSTFRCRVTDVWKEKNEIDVYVTNELSGTVYPQQADFTFYGGIYRDVNLIVVPKSHFELEYYGTPGIKVTPKVKGDIAEVLVEIYAVNSDDMDVEIKLSGLTKVKKVCNGYASVTFEITNPHLWNGITDPYLYNVSAKIATDEISTRFGIREFRMDPNEGFILNGKKYMLRGVARHQDRELKGCALSHADHEEDLKLIMDMGATSIRLAHYQHDQYFYDLCDENGIIVWAEIPYISEHLSNGYDNTISQMKDLIIQNYNHPSIVCWGLSNEICITNNENEGRYQNHVDLNTLCHKLDSTRPTVMAHIGGFSFDTNKLFNVPDIHGSNIYYGWYEKKVEDVKEYFDSRHHNHPTKCLSISEYGADCNPKYCGLDSERGDYSENYQCFYHENMLKIIEERPYLWASYVWNMFDFGADGRGEGGKPGQNQKGLVTFDRKYKKDAYYLYKCHWNKEPMIHICNKHYQDRTETKTRVVVYSNLDTVSLYLDGKKIEEQKGMYKYTFEFDISNEHEIVVKSGNLVDSMNIKYVDEPNPSYHLDNKAIINWLAFIDKEKEGYFTLDSAVKDILAHKEASVYMLEALKPYGITRELLTSDNPRSPGTTMEQIPIKFVLRICKGLTPEEFNSFADGLMKIKI